MKTRHQFPIVQTMFSCLRRSLFMLALAGLLSACQSITGAPTPESDASHYYLWIKTLSDEELAAEITRQKQNKLNGVANTDLLLVMLHSLPNAPIHNPYTAKAQLNTYQLEPYNHAIFTPKDLAFIVMLKDQLNQQLLLLKELENYQGAYHQAQSLIAKQDKQLSQQQLKITQLNKQIVQLKKIEQAINKRGQ
ncbi:hypothetical protein [Thalassotalea fusca]